MEVVAREDERGVGIGAEERRVDDPLHARGHRRVDRRRVARNTIARLLEGDEQQRVHAVEGRAHVAGVAAVGDLPDLGAVQVRRP